MTSGSNDWQTEEAEALIEAFLALRTSEEAARFLRDLCTHKELSDLSHRWTVARLIDEGLSYREISELTGASTATITRVGQWLRHGEGGYRLILDRLAQAEAQP